MNNINMGRGHEIQGILDLKSEKGGVMCVVMRWGRVG